jgi:predicted dehydrogenase
VTPLRIGILGASRIAPTAVLEPARRVPGVEVVAVAARDTSRAERYARKHGIATVLPSYEALVTAPVVDAVYNPLPNGLHGHWTLAALAAGKHVLCEKPFTANADEAADVARAADASALVVMEAFHYRYHPLADLMVSLTGEEAMGRVRHIEARAIVPYFKPGDIRFDLALAGGSLMDIGCYAVHQVRSVAGAEPQVVSARAKEKSPGIDRWMEAHLRFADGRTGRIVVAMYSLSPPMLDLRVQGDQAVLRVLNPTRPHSYNRISLKPVERQLGHEPMRQRVGGEGSTYWYQLRAFESAVRDGTPVLTDAHDAVRTMSVIDAMYSAAGMRPRQPTPVDAR